MRERWRKLTYGERAVALPWLLVGVPLLTAMAMVWVPLAITLHVLTGEPKNPRD